MSAVQTLAQRATEDLAPLERWAAQCHGASAFLVKKWGEGRVARGVCPGVGGQHSWVVLSDDVYDRDALIVDPTLWSYDPDVEGVVVAKNDLTRWRPFGHGSIWDWGRPNPASGPVVELKPRRSFSVLAQHFLDMLGPLDREGWVMLAHAPMEGWPSREIIDAMCEDPDLYGRIPIDIVGMLTDRKPELYLP